MKISCNAQQGKRKAWTIDKWHASKTHAALLPFGLLWLMLLLSCGLLPPRPVRLATGASNTFMSVTYTFRSIYMGRAADGVAPLPCLLVV